MHENCSWCQDLTITIFAGAPFVRELLIEILYAGETRSIMQYRAKKKKKVSRSLLLSFQITPFFSTPRLFTIEKEFPENRLESRWNTPLGSFQRKISGSNGTSEKVVLFFWTEYSKRKFVFDFFKAIFDTSFRPSRSFFGKWNWFVQMVNAIPGRNFPVLNFECHLPKPWTDWFAHVKGIQTIFTASTSCF